MGKEILAIPEESLAEVIDIIRIGLDVRKNTTPKTEENLKQWCDDEEAYLNGMDNGSTCQVSETLCPYCFGKGTRSRRVQDHGCASSMHKAWYDCSRCQGTGYIDRITE